MLLSQDVNLGVVISRAAQGKENAKFNFKANEDVTEILRKVIYELYGIEFKIGATPDEMLSTVYKSLGISLTEEIVSEVSGKKETKTQKRDIHSKEFINEVNQIAKEKRLSIPYIDADNVLHVQPMVDVLIEISLKSMLLRCSKKPREKMANPNSMHIVPFGNDVYVKLFQLYLASVTTKNPAGRTPSPSSTK